MSAPDRGLTRRGVVDSLVAGLVVALVAALVVAMVATGFTGGDAAIAAPEAPAFAERFVAFDPPVPLDPIALLDRDGRSAVLAAQPGRRRLIVLWANWCPACHREVPALAAAQHDLARQGLDVALVNIDAAPFAGIKIRSAAISTGALPSFFDPDGGRLSSPLRSGRRSPLQIFGMPILFVVDRAGLVRGYVKGGVDWANPTVIAFFGAIDDGPSR